MGIVVLNMEIVMNYKNCENCEKEIPIDTVYCPFCGMKQPPITTGNSETNLRGAYNETSKPGLIPSTKLFFNDIFTVNKCMGRADFWWSCLGVNILFALIELILISLNGFTMALKLIFDLMWLLTIPSYIRRLHDVGKSGWNYLWFLTGIGAFYVIYLLIKPTNWASTQWPRIKEI